jgi:hypothetical protein
MPRETGPRSRSKRELSVPLARELQLIGSLELSADTRAAAGCATVG